MKYQVNNCSVNIKLILPLLTRVVYRFLIAHRSSGDNERVKE